MTFPDPNLERLFAQPGTAPENRQDVIPPTERSQDTARDDLEHGRGPYPDEEQSVADQDAAVAERVYAPASERVPVEPVPGHRDFIEHPDTHTPEREAAGYPAPTVSPAPTTAASSGEASTRGIPSGGTTTMDTPARGTYASARSQPGVRVDGTDENDASRWQTRRRRRMIFGLGFSWFSMICAGVCLWLFMRWQRERNKPINRIRRQAVHAAAELRERVPNPEDAAKPAMGLTTALISILILLWQQAQARSKNADRVAGRHASRASRRATKMQRQADKAFGRASSAVSDVDWQKRLTQLKERWTPGRVELEKISISRH